MCISQISPCMRCTHVSWLALGSKGRINLVRVGFDQLFSPPKIDSINKSRNIQEMKNWQKWLSWGCIRCGIVHRYFLGLIWNWFSCQSFGRRTFKPPKRTKKFLTASSSRFVIWNIYQEFGSNEFKLEGKIPTNNQFMNAKKLLSTSWQLEAQMLFRCISSGGQRVRLTREWGSFILHLLLGLCWDEVWNCWDRSQLSPSQTPTNHPSGFI